MNYRLLFGVFIAIFVLFWDMVLNLIIDAGLFGDYTIFIVMVLLFIILIAIVIILEKIGQHEYPSFL